MSDLSEEELKNYLHWQIHQYEIWCWITSERLGFDVRQILSNEALVMGYLHDNAKRLHNEYFN